MTLAKSQGETEVPSPTARGSHYRTADPEALNPANIQVTQEADCSLVGPQGEQISDSLMDTY